jgi:hypothetical protein
MKVPSWIVIGGLGALAACPHANPPVVTPAVSRACPYPPTCTVPNGTGVYTAEDGVAGIGPSDLMITHFINPQGTQGHTRVEFQGRYRADPSSQGASHWRLLEQNGVVLSADYAGKTGWIPVAVTDDGTTTPTWTLADPVTGAAQPVVGPQLVGLTLTLRFATIEEGMRDYLIDFAGPPIDHANATGRIPTSFHMEWATSPTEPKRSYCHDAANQPDAVVFQAGLDVEPVTGAATHGAPTGLVTLSCFLGAPATVYRWGYNYQERDPFHFDAGIHMKRASYCADADYFTVAGTEIEISDEANQRRPPNVEAWWTPTGATCVDAQHRRHPKDGRVFSGSCGGKPLPTVCPPPPGQPAAKRWLIDGLP